MEDRNLQLKYDILKARIATLIDEHADALALAQMFKKELETAKQKLKEVQTKVSAFEGALKINDVQKEKPRVTIVDEPVATTEDQS